MAAPEAGVPVEPIREAEPWETKTNLEKRNGGGDGGRGLQLQYTGKDNQKSCSMEAHCWWPMLHPGVKGDDDDDDDDVRKSLLLKLNKRVDYILTDGIKLLEK